MKKGEWQKNLNNFIKEYKDKFSSCFMVGSLVYQNRFLKKSDIDLVVVLNNLEEWDYACRTFLKNSDRFIEETKKIYKKGEVQYFCLKFKYQKVLYSVDFVLKDFFDKAIKDLSKNKSVMYYKITNEPQTNSYEFGYKSKRILIKKENVFYKESVAVSSPLCAILKSNFYFGIMLDKLLTGYTFLWGDKNILKKANDLCLNAVSKWILINKSDKIEDIIYSLNRIDLLPQKHIKKQILFYKNNIMNQKIEKIYSEAYSLFKDDTKKKEYQYVRRNWIFPNHIDLMIDIVKKLNSKYGGDLEICILSSILHDTGLVYKRNLSSPVGHEKRSIEYAKKILNKYGYSNKEIEEIAGCIKSTNSGSKPKSINEKVVRTADALSQFKSIHFFAKASFSQDIVKYIKWLEIKVEKNFKKVCFKEEREQIKPIKDYISKAIKIYYKYNKS